MAGYRWARIDVDYFRNPKIRSVSPQARLLHIAAILWTTQFSYDGHIPTISLTDLEQDANISRYWGKRRVDELVAAHLWEPNGDGWYLHDYDVMNPQAMKANVEYDRARWRERQARWRKGKHDDVTP